MGELLRARSRIVTVLAIFAVVAGVALGAPFGSVPEADADAICNYTFNPGTYSGKGFSHPWDGDGCVREGYGTVGTCSNNIIGFTRWWAGGTGSSGPKSGGIPYQHQILYDSCEMNAHNADSADWGNLYRHERAHSRGWGHYEGTKTDNAAWDPIAVYW